MLVSGWASSYLTWCKGENINLCSPVDIIATLFLNYLNHASAKDNNTFTHDNQNSTSEYKNLPCPHPPHTANHLPSRGKTSFPDVAVAAGEAAAEPRPSQAFDKAASSSSSNKGQSPSYKHQFSDPSGSFTRFWSRAQTEVDSPQSNALNPKSFGLNAGNNKTLSLP